VQHAAHLALQGLINDLVLLDAGFAPGMAALIIDSISWASIGIQSFSNPAFRSRSAVGTGT
jgi:hypothetical protein